MSEERGQFDFEAFKKEAADKLRNGGDVYGKDGVFTDLFKQVLEAGLSGELDAHVDQTRKHGNRKNGKGKKRVKSSHGEVEIDTPRDRDGSFQPQLIGKRQNSLGKDLDRKILGLYSHGMSLSGIRDQLKEMYDVDISEATLSRVTDQIIPVLEEWHNRPLSSIYPFVWLDAIHYKVREDGRVISKAIYCVIGINLEGYKDVLGLYIGEAEGARFWLQVLDDLKNRGIEDIFIASIDNLNGFAEAIETVFPEAEVQLCIIHQIRNNLKYFAREQRTAFITELKKVYQATNSILAATALDELEVVYGKKYPMVIKSWRKNWDRLSTYFDYPSNIRRMIYTTNIIEGFHRQLRKVTKTKGAFSSDMALMKLVYLTQKKVVEKWHRKHPLWPETLAQLHVLFGDRIERGM